MDLANALEDKILGCLLGGALGNAMGSIVENWTYERIERTYGRIEEPLLLDRIVTEDDTRVAMLYCEAYLKYQRHVTPEEFAAVWQARFDPGTEFFWCLRNATELLARGVPPRQVGMYNVNTGSALMAIAPVGIFNMFEPRRAFSDALDLAYVYQPQPDATYAAIFAAGVAEAFRPGATPASVVETIGALAPDVELVYWDDRALANPRAVLAAARDVAAEFGDDWWAARPVIYDHLTQWHPIDPGEVLAIATCLFQMTGGVYRAGVVAGTNIGRDADTIANLIGGLCGAMHGVDAIPGEWVEGVAEIAPELLVRFTTTARGLARVLEKKWEAYARVGQYGSNLLGNPAR